MSSRPRGCGWCRPPPWSRASTASRTPATNWKRGGRAVGGCPRRAVEPRGRRRRPRLPARPASHPSPTGPVRSRPAIPTDRSSRLRSAAERIRGTVPEMPDDARTSADPETGEQWDRGQVLAHVAEILPYWSEQVELVVEWGGGVSFGRVKSDPERIAAIERDRGVDTAELLRRVDQGLQRVLELLDRLDMDALERTGTHERLGEMTAAAIIDRFVVEHLEEHAEQLEETAGA